MLKNLGNLVGTDFVRQLNMEVPQKRGTSTVIASKTWGEFGWKDYQSEFVQRVKAMGIKYYAGDPRKERSIIESLMKTDTPDTIINAFDWIVSEDQNLVPPEEVGLYLLASGWRQKVFARANAWKEGSLLKVRGNRPPREFRGMEEGITIS